MAGLDARRVARRVRHISVSFLILGINTGVFGAIFSEFFNGNVQGDDNVIRVIAPHSLASGSPIANLTVVETGRFVLVVWYSTGAPFRWNVVLNFTSPAGSVRVVRDIVETGYTESVHERGVGFELSGPARYEVVIEGTPAPAASNVRDSRLLVNRASSPAALAASPHGIVFLAAMSQFLVLKAMKHLGYFRPSEIEDWEPGAYFFEFVGHFFLPVLVEYIVIESSLGIPLNPFVIILFGFFVALGFSYAAKIWIFAYREG